MSDSSRLHAQPLDKQRFIEQYASSSGMSVEEVLADNVCLPCACGDPICRGWAMVSNSALAIRAHMNIYGPAVAGDATSREGSLHG